MIKLHSLRFRLILALALVVVAVAGGIAFAGAQVTSRIFEGDEHQQGMMRDARFHWFLGGYYARHGGWTNVQPEVERIGQITGGRVILVDVNGYVVADSDGELIGQQADDDWDVPTEPVRSGPIPVGYLIFNPPEPIGEKFLASANRTLLLVAAAAGIGAVLLVLGLSRRILAPVEALTAAARRMAAGDLSQRVDAESEDEIGDLARAFNAMADGLTRLEELRRNMVTDVAHELRTPLTNIRGYLEALRDGVVEQDDQLIDSLYDEAMLLNRLVDDLQELSLAEAGQITLQRQPVAIAEVAERAVEAARLRAEAAGVTLGSDVRQDLPLVDVDPQRVGQVLRNLLENGIANTPPGGDVSVTAQVAEGMVEVRVRDTGIGISAEDLPHIFERFYRADKSRSRATGGAGLGLTIARQLVEAHGGHIWAESAEGVGSTFVFTLPLSDESGREKGV